MVGAIQTTSFPGPWDRPWKMVGGFVRLSALLSQVVDRLVTCRKQDEEIGLSSKIGVTR